MDTWNNRIQKFDSEGTFLHMWGTAGTAPGELGIPRGIAVDLAENVYVADYDNHRIQKFDGNGSFLATWGSRGSGDGQFLGPGGVAIGPDGNLYVTDANNRIQVFDGNGSFLVKWGSFGSGDGQFQHPRGISLDTNGNVYVADFFNRRIQKFDGNGGFLTKWGSFGSGDGEFNQPNDVAVDLVNKVYVSDTGNNRIQKFGFIPTDMAANDGGTRVALHAPSPNPMHGRTQIAFAVGTRGSVAIRIYDVRGRLIRTLVDEVRGPGSHVVSWDGLDGTRAPVPTSTYFLRLKEGTLVRTERVTVMD
jgi:DNA-binding beta-propeller fold protein YncE